MFILLASLAHAIDLDAVLRMEQPGWQASPSEEVRPETVDVYEGASALVLSRTAASRLPRTEIHLEAPGGVRGHRLVLRGWLDTTALEGRAGLFVNVDGTPVWRVAKRHRDGWQQVTLRTRIDDPRRLVIGAWIEGLGDARIDGLTLSVDGRPWSESRVGLGWETDHRFDGGSGLVLSTVSARQRDALVRLAKVWGFVKVHHPAVRRGEVHIDYALFEVLPAVLAARDAAAVDAVLAAWIDGLGEITPCDPCAAPPSDAVFTADLDWIRGDSTLAQRLARVHAARGAKHRLVGLSSVGSLDFTREVAFDTVDPHDPGHRLLAVFRFWNTVEWWHPYRDGVQGDWDAALARAIDEVIAAPDVAALGVALLRLHVPVSDGHTTLRRALDHRPPSGDCAVDAEVRFLRSDAVVWMEGGGLALGDRVLDIDGRSPEQLVAEWAPLFAASNEAARQRDLARHLFVGDCGPTTVRVRRDGQVMEIPTERVQRSWPRLVHDLPGEAFQLLTPEIAYLQLSRVRASEVPDHVDAAAGTRGWVLDLRGYPSDNVAYALGAHLVQQRTSFARSSVADLANPGTFVMGAAAELTPAAPFYEGKVAILVDEVTQSAAEYAAMAFRAAPRARVFGSTTAGADGSTTRIALSGGWESVITGVGVFWPDGTPTQQVGIVPDVEVVPTAAGIASERDEVLEAARAWILSED